MLSIVTSVAEAGRADVGDPKDRRGTPSDGDGVFFFSPGTKASFFWFRVSENMGWTIQRMIPP